MPEYPELKRERCRCGGSGILHISKKEGINYYRVQCESCWIRTFDYQDAAFAVKRWNDVMAEKTAETERTAKVECIAEVYRTETVDHYLSGICEICGNSTYDHAKYCSECGAKLNWGE